MQKRISHGFTIVELLVVIVVIGVLATITIISFTGVQQKAIVATLQSDLYNASKQLKQFQLNTDNPSGDYPGQNQCPTPTAGNICLKTSSGNTVTTYTPDNGSNPKTFILEITNANGTKYRITDDSVPVAVVSLAVSDPDNWLAIGTQVWGKYNLNVGTRIHNGINQTNNATLEKYCYNNLESNCTTYGGLYQWNEAMQYVTTSGAQGICPAGSHIPSDNDWKILEVQLGMSQVHADASGDNRGTDQGTQLITGGSSGLNVPFAGWRGTTGAFNYLSTRTILWSSSEYSTGSISAWYRFLMSDTTMVSRNTAEKTFGVSVRCLEN